MKVQNESLNMIMKNFVEKRKYDEDLLESILHQYEINEESILQLLRTKLILILEICHYLMNALFILVFVSSFILIIQKYNH